MMDDTVSWAWFYINHCNLTEITSWICDSLVIGKSFKSHVIKSLTTIIYWNNMEILFELLEAIYNW